MARINQYFPQSIPHPGETLSEKLEELGIGAKELAIKTNKPEKTISAVLNGESSITPDMAIVFENVLKIPARFWLENQSEYDEFEARTKRCAVIEAAKDWASQFPYKEMARLSWVRSTRNLSERADELLKFFAIADQTAWENYYLEQKLKLNFRISLKQSKAPYAISAWLRQGEILASNISAPDFDEKKFKEKLLLIKNIMAEQTGLFFNELQHHCAEAGVVVVYTPNLPKAPISGSTRWLNGTPLIQLSARYKQNDQFWFTFFHEAGHILLHGKKYISIENVEYVDAEHEKEIEADEFAISWTFSREQEAELRSYGDLTKENILKFAKKINTHPAMIVGRFHHNRSLHYSAGREFIVPISL